MPPPGWFTGSCTAMSSPAPARASALPSGCSESRSRAAASARQRCASTSAQGTTSRSCKLPVVSVPVLSKMKSSAMASRSSASEDLQAIPRFIKAADAEVTALGVASASAQGQVTTSTEMVTGRTSAGSTCHQYIPTARASASTQRIKQDATRSANPVSRDLCACACSANPVIFIRTDPSPTCSTRTCKGEAIFVLPPVRRSPGPLLTGRPSPVMIASSTSDWPRTTVPSAGMTSPGRTAMRSPGCSSATGMVSRLCPGPSSTSLTAVAGMIFFSPASRLFALCRAMNSRWRLSERKNTSMTMESK